MIILSIVIHVNIPSCSLKQFGSKTAVNNLTFGVEKKEIFGLLGVNGAGKTTTFRMITSELLPNRGQLWASGIQPSSSSLKLYRSQIGYCPQVRGGPPGEMQFNTNEKGGCVLTIHLTSHFIPSHVCVLCRNIASWLIARQKNN